jgi:hypothetical protein
MVGSLSAQEGHGMTLAHYRINELDAADRMVDGYAVMCRSDAAALTMASRGAEDRAAAVEVWEGTRHVARLDLRTLWHRLRSRWTRSSTTSGSIRRSVTTSGVSRFRPSWTAG